MWVKAKPSTKPAAEVATAPTPDTRASQVLAEEKATEAGAKESVQSSDTFNLEEIKAQIGNYGDNWGQIGSHRAQTEGSQKAFKALSNEAKAVLFDGVKKTETLAREEFLTALHERLPNIPQGKYNKTITLKKLLGKDVFKLYKKAVKEERNSKEFIRAVFIASSEALDKNPCGDKKVVMYVGGPSAAGKSFTRKAFFKELTDLKKGESIPPRESFLVSVDGGIDRELSQIRQIVLQLAVAMGYLGIQDLHKHTKTSVKKRVQKAAMAGGNNYHMAIPATFISGLAKFKKQMKALTADPNIFQVYAEVRSDHSSKSWWQAHIEFQQTILYNGNSRAWMDPKKPYKGEIRMNNRNIGCESKEYERKYFESGIIMSKQAKKFFRSNSKNDKAIIMSNESDNMHLKNVGTEDDPKWVQDSKNPDIKHISKRELNLWNSLKDINFDKDTIASISDESRFDEISDFRAPNIEATSAKAILYEFFKASGYEGDLGKKSTALLTELANEEKFPDLKSFQKFLRKNDAGAKLKITTRGPRKTGE